MSASTIKTTVEFGEKVSFTQTETCSYSTTVNIDEMSLAQSIPFYSGTYKKIDYSDEKKMEAYRKINKMLGGK